GHTIHKLSIVRNLHCFTFHLAHANLCFPLAVLPATLFVFSALCLPLPFSVTGLFLISLTVLYFLIEVIMGALALWVLGTAEEQEDCTITFLIKMNLCNWEITANFALVVARQFYQGAIYESLVLGLLASLSQQMHMRMNIHNVFVSEPVAHYIHENIHMHSAEAHILLLAIVLFNFAVLYILLLSKDDEILKNKLLITEVSLALFAAILDWLGRYLYKKTNTSLLNFGLPCILFAHLQNMIILIYSYILNINLSSV
ncbi:hypothetical protein ACJX0J_030147, partial [Zea mays]